MFKKIIIALFLAIPFTSIAQNYNPFVAQGIVSPAPLDNVASNGTGVVSFLVGNTGDDALPLITNQEMLLVITLSRGVPNNADPIAAISGSMASYFDWQYDAGTLSYLGTQNQLIPDALNGGVGNIEILYKVTSNSLETSPQNGFNVNLTPPAYTNGIQSLNDDQVSSYTWTEAIFETTPDMNATFKDSTVSGSVHTNDNIPTGSTYGIPSPLNTNPAPSTINMNTDGTYTFMASAPGVYKFNVPVCPIGQTTNCPTELLVITVTDNSIQVNPPTANVDLGITYGQAPVTVNTLGNDACNNLSCALSPSSVTIVSQPQNGTATVDPLTGNITYIANSSFYGVDTLIYSVCDTSVSPIQCATAYQYFEVLPNGSANRVALNDDYAVVQKNTNATGNLLFNDADPESNTLTATAQNITIAGKGTFTLSTNGTYTFTPNTDFVGTVEIPYEACDNGTPQACAKATLYISVSPISIPLPIVWKSFTATNNNCSVELVWMTAEEKNVSHFDIYRKGTKNISYEKIGTTVAKGNATGNIYNFIDNKVETNQYIYQIKSIDFDGKISLSEEKGAKVKCILSEEISVYPNPINDYINIKIDNPEKETYTIKLLDMSGRVVMSTDFSVENNQKLITIPVSHLANGLYQINVINSFETKSYKIEKQ